MLAEPYPDGRTDDRSRRRGFGDSGTLKLLKDLRIVVERKTSGEPADACFGIDLHALTVPFLSRISASPVPPTGKLVDEVGGRDFTITA